MQKTEYRCVIDSHGFYKTFVLLESYEENEKTKTRPYSYDMLSGETLIEASPPSDMLKAKWSGNDWQETATKEEIEAAKPEPLPTAPPSETIILKAQVQALSERIDFNEDCLAEMAGAVYAE